MWHESSKLHTCDVVDCHWLYLVCSIRQQQCLNAEQLAGQCLTRATALITAAVVSMTLLYRLKCGKSLTVMNVRRIMILLLLLQHHLHLTMQRTRRTIQQLQVAKACCVLEHVHIRMWQRYVNGDWAHSTIIYMYCSPLCNLEHVCGSHARALDQ